MCTHSARSGAPPSDAHSQSPGRHAGPWTRTPAAGARLRNPSAGRAGTRGAPGTRAGGRVPPARPEPLPGRRGGPPAAGAAAAVRGGDLRSGAAAASPLPPGAAAAAAAAAAGAAAPLSSRRSLLGGGTGLAAGAGAGAAGRAVPPHGARRRRMPGSGFPARHRGLGDGAAGCGGGERRGGRKEPGWCMKFNARRGGAAPRPGGASRGHPPRISPLTRGPARAARPWAPRPPAASGGLRRREPSRAEPRRKMGRGCRGLPPAFPPEPRGAAGWGCGAGSLPCLALPRLASPRTSAGNVPLTYIFFQTYVTFFLSLSVGGDRRGAKKRRSLERGRKTPREGVQQSLPARRNLALFEEPRGCSVSSLSPHPAPPKRQGVWQTAPGICPWFLLHMALLHLPPPLVGTS